MASSLQDFPSVTYESDQEIPNWQPCLIIHTYQNNHLRGHYLKIKGDRITANACQGDNNITLSYATFADNESSDLIIICDSSKKRFLAYKDDYNGPAIYIKECHVSKATKIHTAKEHGIVFVKTHIEENKICLQPWIPHVNSTHFLAFDDEGQVMDPSSPELGKNNDRCKFRFLGN